MQHDSFVFKQEDPELASSSVKVKVYNETPWPLPEYATPQSSGFDLRAFIPSEYVLAPGESILVPTGLYFQLPPFLEMQVRPRSGLAAKFGISIVNSPGTVDADYRGQVHVNLINLGKSFFTIKPGDRIAQGILAPVFQASWVPVSSKEELSETERGDQGHGHSGI